MFTEDTKEGLVEQLAIYQEYKSVMGSDLEENTLKAIEQDIKCIKARLDN